MESPDATEIEQKIRFKSTQEDDFSYPVFNKTRSAIRFNKQSGTLPAWVNSGRVVDTNFRRSSSLLKHERPMTAKTAKTMTTSANIRGGLSHRTGTQMMTTSQPHYLGLNGGKIIEVQTSLSALN
jgi:hypothetical protein